MIAEKQGDFTAKLSSILQQAGNINMSAINEYTWISTDGQVSYSFPITSTYSSNAKWLRVYVGGVPVDTSLVNNNFDSKFELLIDPVSIKAGTTILAQWLEPIAPIVPTSYKVIPQQPTPPADAEEGDLWFDTSDDTYQGTIFEELDTKIQNQRVDVMVDYKAVGDDVSDDGTKIQQAITDVFNSGGGTVFFPKPPVKYKFSQMLLIPENVFLEGIGEGTTGSRLHYTGSSWALVTSSKHQRNQFRKLRFDLNGTGNGVRLGDVAANLGGQIPLQFLLEDVTFENIASGKQALQTVNVSHISLKRVRIGYGSVGGGNALKITADGNINSGVFKAEDCTFGRVDATDIALELDAPCNLDSYNFDTCYFGGQRVIVGATDYVRSLNFEACHGEFRLLTGSALPNIDAFQLSKVYGGSWKGGTINCFSGSGSNAFRFKSDVKRFNIEGVEANGVMGAVYLQDASTTLEGCILQEANLTGGSTAVQFSGVSDYNVKILQRRLQSRYMNTQYLCSLDGQVMVDFGTQSPTLDSPVISWNRGSERINTVPTELGTTGSKYVLRGWKCISTGTPGTWVEMRTLTGN
jgi:hypothetical protein